MTIRLQEVRPAVAHLPLALLPVAIGADLLGRVVGNSGLRETARHLMPVVAGAAAAAAVTGLGAQDDVATDSRAHDMMVTHRAINLTIAGAAAALASWRWRRSAPSVAYLGLGMAAIGLAMSSVYLATKLVDEYGAGIDAAAHQLRPGGAVHHGRAHAAAAARTAAGDMMRGLPHAVSELLHGDLTPAVRDRRGHHAARGTSGATP
jgi:uncharacterized membrane protein